METHGSVLAPQNGSKGRKRPNIETASINAPAGSHEHALAVKRGHYQRVIPECRGLFQVDHSGIYLIFGLNSDLVSKIVKIGFKITF